MVKMETVHLRPVVAQKVKYREAAYTAIKAAILAGELPFEQPLVEEQLAAQLQISRTPVREALAILEHEGLIGPGAGRGLYIHAAPRDVFAALFAANEVVAAYLVRRATYWATEELLRLLEETLSRNRYYADRADLPHFLETGREFWRHVGMAAENPPLTDFIVNNAERADLYLLAHLLWLDGKAMQDSSREYTAILEALIKRDPDETARLVAYHAQSLRARLPAVFEAAPGDATDQEPDLPEFF